uniref:Uncharacterized protein n=1 Tax=Gasterosteus aculeatus TaxID=69293 RepID=G3P190_GASAC
MVNISILRVESPSCIWGRFVQDPGSGTDQYDRLQAQMNLFYKDVTQDLRHLKPTSLEEGQLFLRALILWNILRLPPRLRNHNMSHRPLKEAPGQRSRRNRTARPLRRGFLRGPASAHQVGAADL